MESWDTLSIQKPLKNTSTQSTITLYFWIQKFICLSSDIHWRNDHIAQIPWEVTPWNESERIDVHIRGDFSSAFDGWSCSDVAHELALLCLDKDILFLDLKMQSLTFAVEAGVTMKKNTNNWPYFAEGGTKWFPSNFCRDWSPALSPSMVI